MEDWEKEAQKDMFEIDRLLSKFWCNGFISNNMRQQIWNEFPPRLRDILYQK
jgi:isochorismate hydrolase